MFARVRFVSLPLSFVVESKKLVAPSGNGCCFWLFDYFHLLQGLQTNEASHVITIPSLRAATAVGFYHQTVPGTRVPSVSQDPRTGKFGRAKASSMEGVGGEARNARGSAPSMLHGKPAGPTNGPARGNWACVGSFGSCELYLWVGAEPFLAFNSIHVSRCELFAFGVTFLACFCVAT